MGKWRNVENGMVVSVDDSKDERYKSRLFEQYAGDDKAKAAALPAEKKAAAKKTTTASSDKK
jgi:hypothetical protein